MISGCVLLSTTPSRTVLLIPGFLLSRIALLICETCIHYSESKDNPSRLVDFPLPRKAQFSNRSMSEHVGQSHHRRVSSQMIEAGNSTLTSWFSVYLPLFFLLLEFVVIGYFFLHYQDNDAGNLMGIFVDFRDFFDCGSETFLVALLFMVQDKFLPKHH